MKRNRRGWIGAALLALVLVPALASAQATQVGQLAGEVKDATGGVLPGATVTLTSVERGFSRIAVTDTSGKFLFAVVPIGRYTVNVKMPSFQTVTITDNLVESERTTNRVGPVEGGRRRSRDHGRRRNAHRGREEPDARDAAARRGVQQAGGRTELPDADGLDPRRGGPPSGNAGNMNSHGALTSNNIFMFDGVNTTDPTTGTFGTNLNFEAIQEMVVRTSCGGRRVRPRHGCGGGRDHEVRARTGSRVRSSIS